MIPFIGQKDYNRVLASQELGNGLMGYRKCTFPEYIPEK